MSDKEQADDQVDDKEGVQNAEIVNDLDDKQTQKEDAAPKDVRGSIRAAIKETEEKQEKENKIDDSDESSSKKKIAKGSVNKVKDFDPLEDESSEQNEKESSREEKKEKQPKEEKIEATGYWKAKAKDVWDELPNKARQAILAREKEVSDGFAQYSPRLKAFEELERVIAPRSQYIQAYGTTPAETIDKLFQWMEALSHPDVNVKTNNFKVLAQNFGIDVNRLFPRSKNSNNQSQTEENIEDQQQQETNNGPPEWFNQYAQNVDTQIGGLQQVIASQKQQAAASLVDSWATAKDAQGNFLRPHFDKVRQLMAQLSTPATDPRTGQVISPAVVPLKNGQIDLDGAYEAAVKLHPEVAAQIQQEAAQKAEKDAQDKARKEAKDRADRLAKAKKAGAGLKPAAPAMGASLNQNARNLNGKGPRISARDSIKAALDELRE